MPELDALIRFRVDSHLKARLQQIAKRKRRPLSNIILEILARYADEEDPIVDPTSLEALPTGRALLNEAATRYQLSPEETTGAIQAALEQATHAPLDPAPTDPPTGETPPPKPPADPSKDPE